MKEVFGLFSGAYSDWSCHGYYTTSEEAEKAAIKLTKDGDGFFSDSYYVVPLKCLDGVHDLYKGEVIYMYSVRFSRHCCERDKDYTEFKPYIEVKTFSDDDYRVSHLIDEEGIKETLQDKIRITTNPLWSDYLMVTWHNNRYMNEDEIKKVAYDKIAKWKAENIGL